MEMMSFVRGLTAYRPFFLLLASLMLFGTMAAFPVGSPALPPQYRAR